jgi:frataxin-like iron-binding protein CyaY
MDEQEFKNESTRAMESLFKKLSKATEQYEFEPDFNAGALSIEFEEPKAKFVVSPNAPVRQIWVSAHSKSFKLDWDPAFTFRIRSVARSAASVISRPKCHPVRQLRPIKRRC